MITKPKKEIYYRGDYLKALSLGILALFGNILLWFLLIVEEQWDEYEAKKKLKEKYG